MREKAYKACHIYKRGQGHRSFKYVYLGEEGELIIPLPQQELDGVSLAELLTSGTPLPRPRVLLHHCGRILHALRLVQGRYCNLHLFSVQYYRHPKQFHAQICNLRIDLMTCKVWKLKKFYQLSSNRFYKKRKRNWGPKHYFSSEDGRVYKMYIARPVWYPGSTQCGWGPRTYCPCAGPLIQDLSQQPLLFDLQQDPYEDRPIPTNTTV